MVRRSLLSLLILLLSLAPGAESLSHSYPDDLQTGWVYEDKMKKYGFGEGFLHSHSTSWWYVSHLHAGFDYTDTELLLGWNLPFAAIYNYDPSAGVYKRVWFDRSHDHFHDASWGAYIHEFWPVDSNGDVIYIRKGANLLRWNMVYHYKYACPSPGLPNKKCTDKKPQKITAKDL